MHVWGFGGKLLPWLFLYNCQQPRECTVLSTAEKGRVAAWGADARDITTTESELRILGRV